MDVYNDGGQPTTLTTATYKVYASRLAGRMGRKAQEAFVIADLKPDLPVKLSPGEQWRGVTRRDDWLDGMIRGKIVYAEIYRAGSDKPIRIRLIHS
ncbi:hypothetical protein [Roseateles sp.]|uniref:hypothetical protein n=1 Tax=Roseateles sp. TaxID=1971397 RepID=UPI0031D70537